MNLRSCPLAPFVLPLKVLMQRTCVAPTKLEWDDQLPSTTEDSASRAVASLNRLQHLKIPRCYSRNLGKVVNRQLHIFSDGSEVAYGASVYLRQTDSVGRVSVCLIIAKSRITPAGKLLTIPRAELCGCEVAATLVDVVRRELHLPIDGEWFWTDSTAALGYLNNVNKRYQVFVANRCRFISAIAPPERWRHVGGRTNPADFVTRPTLVKEGDSIHNFRSWFFGPEWLELDEDAPKQGHFSVADFTTPRLNSCFLPKPSLRCWSASSWGGLRSRKRGASKD